ncbi:Mannosyl-oligosaccharide 1,2-alpha-mannosidase MNS1 [Histomonas meleagridis]|uniref:Mannosyl-oligosaccharide 1,2-alpha-mannosidase MNS1 n=1 Tax=Histomonas meleagridis TaxID=135588 RepID=UPI0035593AFE|nr:Mannosyl-oligosaccharide 1,2-alpha-mannosidase MNS1 [Histomonas meleagridis]KAH0804008.1 Mannosyl-oligosaccharide 1,2-alpha-mannosidase MNS1 [Histomonas meleagridis]
MLQRNRTPQHLPFLTLFTVIYLVAICTGLFFYFSKQSIPVKSITEVSQTSTANTPQRDQIETKQDTEIKPDTENKQNQQDSQVNQKTEVKQEINNKQDSDQKNHLHNQLYVHDFPKLTADVEKQKAVRDSFLFAWNSYKNYAWGYDFLKPNSKRGQNVYSGGLSITDSLDTLLIMGLDDEFKQARDWVANSFSMSGSYSVFEINIRHIGGLISAYELTGDKMFLDKVTQLADALLPVFNPQTGLFSNLVSIHRNGDKYQGSPHGGDSNYLADVGTIQLEFYTLSMHTGNRKYAEVANRIYKTIFGKYPNQGLYPEMLGVRDGSSRSSYKGIDCSSDSFYEYLIKLYLLTNGTQTKFLDKYLLTTKDIENKLLTTDGKHTWVARLQGETKRNSITHLVTFVAGMLAIGAVKKNPKIAEHMKIADELATTYYKLYTMQPSGLMPECVSFDGKGGVHSCKSEYLLRPETVESLFVLYRFTGLQKYRDYAWEIYKSIEKSCRVENGYTNVFGVDSPNPSHGDTMDSYFLAETFKYLYLIFSSSELIPTAEYVFNTEAHPFKVWTKEQAEKMKDVIGFY